MKCAVQRRSSHLTNVANRVEKEDDKKTERLLAEKTSPEAEKWLNFLIISILF